MSEGERRVPVYDLTEDSPSSDIHTIHGQEIIDITGDTPVHASSTSRSLEDADYLLALQIQRELNAGAAPHAFDGQNLARPSVASNPIEVLSVVDDHDEGLMPVDLHAAAEAHFRSFMGQTPYNVPSSGSRASSSRAGRSRRGNHPSEFPPRHRNHASRRSREDAMAHSILSEMLHDPRFFGRRGQQQYTLHDFGFDMAFQNFLPAEMQSYEQLLSLAENLGNVETGLSSSQMERLPQIKFDPTKPPSLTSCSICMEEYTNNESLVLLPCLHVFHPACIKTWLQRKKTCPVCRLSVLDGSPSA